MNQKYNLQHLDLKPRNLFVVAGHVKIADFGLVNSVAELTGSAALHLGSITPSYAAPENSYGKINTSSDQYSLAVAYHELLTGQLPFAGKNLRSRRCSICKPCPISPALLKVIEPRWPAPWQRAKDRFPSSSAFVQALTVGTTVSMHMRVPAQTYFAYESEPKPPKLPTRTIKTRQHQVDSQGADDKASVCLGSGSDRTVCGGVCGVLLDGMPEPSAQRRTLARPDAGQPQTLRSLCLRCGRRPRRG